MAEAHGHPHRISIADHGGRVTVTHDGVRIADSARAVALREGSLPVRYYVPRDDVRMDLLSPSATTSHCPFKGDASYWSIDGLDDVAWSYEQPIAGAEAIRGLIAFYGEKVVVDGG